MQFRNDQQAEKYGEYFDDVTFLLAAAAEAAKEEEKWEDGYYSGHHDIQNSSCSVVASSHRGGPPPLKEVPERVLFLHQQGSLKIAMNRERENIDENHDEAVLPKSAKYATERQVALYERGVAKIRQKVILSKQQHQQQKESFRSSHEDLQQQQSLDTLQKKRRSMDTKRQAALYALGVKKLRERNQRELATNQQCSTKTTADAGSRVSFYRRLYQKLHDVVASMDEAKNFSSSMSVPASITTEASHVSRKTEEDLNAKSRGIARIYSKISQDFPELHNLKDGGRMGAVCMARQKKAAMNIKTMCAKSRTLLYPAGLMDYNYTSESRDTETAIGPARKQENYARQGDDADTSSNEVIDENALKVGLHGIVYQYLLDVVLEDGQLRHHRENSTSCFELKSILEEGHSEESESGIRSRGCSIEIHLSSESGCSPHSSSTIGCHNTAEQQMARMKQQVKEKGTVIHDISTVSRPQRQAAAVDSKTKKRHSPPLHAAAPMIIRKTSNEIGEIELYIKSK